jgi:amino acid transporter
MSDRTSSITNRKISLAEAVAMAVGTMIGASIFSIFGVGAGIAGRNLPLSFALSGLYALIVAYSYACLSRSIVSNAGPIAFIISGCPAGSFSSVFSRSSRVRRRWKHYTGM